MIGSGHENRMTFERRTMSDKGMVCRGFFFGVCSVWSYHCMLAAPVHTLALSALISDLTRLQRRKWPLPKVKMLKMSTSITNQQTWQNLVQLTNNMNVINRKVEIASGLGGLTIIDGRGRVHYRWRGPGDDRSHSTCGEISWVSYLRPRLRDGPGLLLLVCISICSRTRPHKFCSAVLTATMPGTGTAQKTTTRNTSRVTTSLLYGRSVWKNPSVFMIAVRRIL